MLILWGDPALQGRGSRPHNTSLLTSFSSASRTTAATCCCPFVTGLQLKSTKNYQRSFFSWPSTQSLDIEVKWRKKTVAALFFGFPSVCVEMQFPPRSHSLQLFPGCLLPFFADCSYLFTAKARMWMRWAHKCNTHLLLAHYYRIAFVTTLFSPFVFMPEKCWTSPGFSLKIVRRQLLCLQLKTRRVVIMLGFHKGCAEILVSQKYTHACTHTCTRSNQYDFTLWFCALPLKLSYNVIIACDKWRGYIQAIKQLIAFDRRHIWSVKMLQAEKWCLSLSPCLFYLPFLLPNKEDRYIYVFWEYVNLQYSQFGYNIINCVNTNHS